jgi:hypothetical protein
MPEPTEAEIQATLDLADTFVATAPAVTVYCTVKGCPWSCTVEPEDEHATRIAARTHVLLEHKSLLLSSEPDTIDS